MISEPTLLSPLPEPANDTEPKSSRSPVLELADGATARLNDGALELCDARGRLLVRYANGTAEISAPAGDLVLSAPHGRVALQSGLDVELRAARDVVSVAGRAVTIGTAEDAAQLSVSHAHTSLTSGHVSVESKEARLTTGVLHTVARKVATEAGAIAVKAERYELTATRLFERSKDAYREVSDLAQTKVGRARTIVATLFSLSAQRTTLRSKEDTAIDGRKILLG